MLEQIWDAILKFTAQLVIPDWGSLIVLLPVFMGFIALYFFGRVILAYATAGPKRRGGGRITPKTPPGVHMPGPTYAPFLAAGGTFVMFLGLVFGGPLVIVGLTALVLSLLYWGREGLAEYDHLVGEHPQIPAVVHTGPPSGVHMPGPSFLPLLAACGVAILFAGLVFGGWLLGFGVVFTIVSLLGWLVDAGKEYHQVVRADVTGHIENEPAPAWPKRLLGLMVVGVVVAVALNLGWFPPRSASGGEAGASPVPSGAPSGPPGGIALIAQGLKFDKSKLSAPANAAFTIHFDNRDTGVSHDVDILDAAGQKVEDGQDFAGPDTRDYSEKPLPAGTYKFECSIHPTSMFGELTVGG